MNIATVSTDNIETAVRAVQCDADLVEVRLDAFWGDVPTEEQATEVFLRLTEASNKLLATLRPTRQGGAWTGAEEARINLLLAACKCGFAAVDLEADLPIEAVNLFRDYTIVHSSHGEVPGRDPGLNLLLAMHDARTQVHKLAFPAASFVETLRAMELAHAHRQRHGQPCIMPMGGGASLRALLALAGNTATYGHAPASPPAIPGQPALQDVQSIWRHWGSDGQPGTGWYAVLGNPVQHSLSPRIHNAAFAAAGLPQTYGALEVPVSPGALRLLCTTAFRTGLLGASVTHPHKQAAAEIVPGDAIVRAIGAANCLRFPTHSDQNPAATNTDATALRRLIAGEVAVLGSGGAAKAALWAAQDAGLPATCIARNGADVAKEFGASYVPWADRASVQADTWIQATTLTEPTVSPTGERAIELVYAHGQTPFQTAAEEANMDVVDGKQFLIEQGVDAFQFWTGDAPDRAAMEHAL